MSYLTTDGVLDLFAKRIDQKAEELKTAVSSIKAPASAPASSGASSSPSKILVLGGIAAVAAGGLWLWKRRKK